MKRRTLTAGAAAALLTAASAGQNTPADAKGPPAQSIVTIARALDAIDPGLATAPLPLIEGAPPPPMPAREVLAQVGEGAASFDVVRALVDAAGAWEEWGRVAGRPSYVLFGMPEDDRLAAARRAAREVAALAAAAIPVIDRAVENADRLPEAQRDAALEEQIERALHARQVVLPLQSARASLLIAATTADDRARTTLARAAGDAARKVADVSAWAECERRLLSGLSFALDGKGEEAASELEAAEAAARAKDADALLRHRVLVEAVFVRALALLRSRGPITARDSLEQAWERPPLLEGGRRETSIGLIAAEMLVRVSREEAARLPSTADRDGPTLAALARYTELLAGLEPDGRTAVYAAMARHVPTTTDATKLPTVARVARAQSRLAAGDGAGAAADLDAIAKVSDRATRGSLDADALLLYARSLAAAQRHTEATEAATAFADRFATDTRAARALVDAASYAQRALAAAPGLPAIDRYSAALTRLDESSQQVPERDAWRLRFPGLIAARPADAGLLDHASRADQALMKIEDVALLEQAALSRLAMWRDVLDRLRWAAADDASLDASVRGAAGALKAAAVEPVAAWERLGFERRTIEAESKLSHAAALVALGDPRGALEQLAGAAADDPASSAVAAGAQIALGAAEAARAALRSLATRTEPPTALTVLRPLAARAWRDAEPRTRDFLAGATPPAEFDPLVLSLHAEFDSSDRAAAERHAWALLLSGDGSRAADLFDRALVVARRSDLLRGLGESSLAAGDMERAFAAFREVAAGLEAVQSYSRDYWHAWTRMLEILAARPDAKERAAAIRREIARLRAMDSAREHPDCLGRIDKIERDLAR